MKNKKCETSESQKSKTLTCSVYDTKSTGQKALDMHIGGRAHQTRERQAKLVCPIERRASYYASLAAAPSVSNSAEYGREDRAQNQSD